MTEPAITLDVIAKRYGSVVAVDDVSLTVAAGTRHAVIGPNGAGKSTLFALVAGTIRPSSGRVRLFGEDVSRLRDHQRARRGLAKTFQHSSVFPTMTLQENALLAAERRHGRPGRAFGRHTGAAAEAASAALDRVGLAGRAQVRADLLSHGERRQLEVALALALHPRVILFDEPTAGMSAAETTRFVDMVRALPRDITILIIEHDLDVVFSLADRVSVLHLGALIADGSPEEIRASELVQRTYLGTAADEPLDPDLPEVIAP
jgi:branched-chain amino acid transport system ATP-binding protein